MSQTPVTLEELDEFIGTAGLPVRDETLTLAWRETETAASAPALPSGQVFLVVTLPVKPDQALRFEAAATEFVRATRTLPGALSSMLLQAGDDPSTWYLVERFVDRDAFERHMASAYFREFQVEQLPLLAGPVEAIFLARSG